MYLPYQKTAIQTLEDHPVLKKAGIRLVIKREDLNHPLVSGNKWWKLKYNFLEAAERNFSTVLTFGGAYSNHLYATAAAAASMNFRSIGVIRGEETLPLNKTLSFARSQGMMLHYMSRSEYRRKGDPDFLDELRRRFEPFYLIPEGGSNLLAVKGCSEFAVNELTDFTFDKLYLAVGTGGTMAGLISGIGDRCEVVGIPVLKDGSFLEEVITRFSREYTGLSFSRWKLLPDYHHGGYAKSSVALLEFIEEMRSVYNVPLDPVYTGKLLWAIIQEARGGAFKRGETILALHTGGLQAATTEP